MNNKQNIINTELPKYMRSINISNYRINLFMKLLRNSDIETVSYQDIAHIYDTVLREVEYRNKKNKNHTVDVNNIYNFIKHITK